MSWKVVTLKNDRDGVAKWAELQDAFEKIFISNLAPTDATMYVSKSMNANTFWFSPGSAAIDAGTVLPGITDGYTGAAPDLGALEAGQPLPVYGPRPLAAQP